MKWIAIALVGFLVVARVNAASFDCAKASSTVEHFICDNTDLSALDQQLAESYKLALQDKENAENVRRAQRAWITARDKCPNVNCVRDAYRKRIDQLGPAQGTSALSATAEGSSGTAAKRYPPYPDIWELQSPLLQSDTNQVIDHLELSNGDMWFSYSRQETLKHNPANHNRPNLQKGITFFGRQAVDLNDTNSEMSLPDGSKVEPLSYGYSGLATLTDGTDISSFENEYKNGCYQGPGENSLIHDRQNGTHEKWLQQKVVFLVLEKPIRLLTGLTKGQQRPAACDTTEERIKTRVVSLAGAVIPLQDGGFLLEDVRYGIVVRFDSNLNTRSSLLNRRVFLMGSDAYERFFMAEVGRKENLDNEGYIKMQSVVDDLYVYLLKQSTRRSD
jgi:uncharacterized protein